MGIEIERKYLVASLDWKTEQEGVLYRQGYLYQAPERTVRVRVAADRAFLTIKGVPQGLVRPEFEYEIPLEDRHELLELCHGSLIEKFRYKINVGGKTWEVDEFLGENKGLVVAEIELESETEDFLLPVWIGKEVSGDPRYSNSSLVAYPFSAWNSP